MEGTLYQRKNGAPQPGDENSFFITQYPSYFGEAGRIVMDFFTEDDIAAVVSLLLWWPFFIGTHTM